MKKPLHDDDIVSIEFISLIEYLDKKKLRDKILKVMCPECGHYIDLNHVRCGCSPPKQLHLFAGCSSCGMQFGQGAFKVHGVECRSCNHTLDFFDPYPFSEGCILLKKNQEGSIWSDVGLILLLVFAFLILKSCLASTNQPVEQEVWYLEQSSASEPYGPDWELEPETGVLDSGESGQWHHCEKEREALFNELMNRKYPISYEELQKRREWLRGNCFQS